jgi:hypothetical protein
LCFYNLLIGKFYFFLGYYRLTREGLAPMASPDPLSMTSDESSMTPDLEIL